MSAGFTPRWVLGGGHAVARLGRAAQEGLGVSTGHPGALAVNGVTPGGAVW